MALSVWLVDHPTSLDESDALTLLDAPSQERVRRFYHRADACRCLIGRLLPRVLLSEHRGVSAEKIHLATTEAGKPYFARIYFPQTPVSSPFNKQLTVILSSARPLDTLRWQVSNFGQPIAFNVSHDNEMVAMAFAPGHHGPPAFLIGVDVMMVQAPTRGAEEGIASFLRAVGDTTLTVAEKHLVSSDVPENEALSRFYLIWTIKEAYTKAIGLGLGFDPSRIEYDMRTNTVAVDGVIATDWKFETSEVVLDEKPYRITVAQFVGSGNDSSGTVVPLAQRQMVCSGASSFVRKALYRLKELERVDTGNIATRYVN